MSVEALRGMLWRRGSSALHGPTWHLFNLDAANSMCGDAGGRREAVLGAPVVVAEAELPPKGERRCSTCIETWVDLLEPTDKQLAEWAASRTSPPSRFVGVDLGRPDGDESAAVIGERSPSGEVTITRIAHGPVGVGLLALLTKVRDYEKTDSGASEVWNDLAEDIEELIGIATGDRT